ncbi:GAF and ANTAR domain-containing protein [Nocardia sp. CDC160]|uniref:GAF and ANTAR domain-containing protein n=1 Tax=Nocardia sp. CDC160 TaxID=3112166 RepID=UPI002DBF6778|nr:GAF and ANTAR domain-containing protein [Nocardia sp. CDC160]MEC3918811.1 GAF and ANTAR domain-containing protein [Nocardia sp. CDC160]
MAYDSAALLKALARFARLLPTEYDVPSALDELVDGLTRVLGLAGAGVSLESEDGLKFITAPNEQIAEIERTQERTGEGPCAEAFERGQPVIVADLSSHAGEWPQYCAAAAQHSIVAAAGVPMMVGEHKVGVTNLYDSRRRDWTTDEMEAARVLADMATGYAVNADKRRQMQQLTEQLDYALKSRIVIEQAKGIIANVHGIGPDEAFVLIRRYARNKQARLHAIASAIVEAGLRI